MSLRIGEIGKKWLLRNGIAFDEIDGLIGNFAIYCLTFYVQNTPK